MGRRVVAAGDPILAFDANPVTLRDSGIAAAASAAELVQSVDAVLLSYAAFAWSTPKRSVANRCCGKR